MLADTYLFPAQILEQASILSGAATGAARDPEEPHVRTDHR